MRVLVLAALLLLGLGGSPGPGPPPSLNDLPLPERKVGTEHTFLVGGHLYGAPRNRRSVFPSASLIANVDVINERGADFFMSLGDAIMYCLPSHYAGFRRGLLDKLELPLFNAVGNHDVAVRKRYLEQFPGKTWYYFVHGGVMHLVVDTELEVGLIAGDQLRSLLAMLTVAVDLPEVRSVAIHSHKLIWTGVDTSYKVVAEHLNNKDGYQSEHLFAKQLLPTLHKLSLKKQVIWFSGDIGCDHSLQLFYDEAEGYDLTWIATGIGDTADDALLEVKVDADGRMHPSVLRLDGKPSKPLASFGPAFWKAHFDKPK